MKIGIDATYAAFRRGGIDTYTYYLVKELCELDSEHTYYLNSMFFPFKISLDSLGKQAPIPIVRKMRMAQVQMMRLVWSKFQAPRVGHLTKNLDVFHSTDHILMPVRKKVKKVITIHDLSFLYQENKIHLSKVYQQDVERSIKGADKIIAVSHFVKGDILKHFPINSDKIDVIHEGVDSNIYYPKQSGTVDERPNFIGENDKYILYVGKIETRKNLLSAIEAFEKAVNKIPENIKLVLCGKPGDSFAEVSLAASKSHVANRIMVTNFVDKKDLPSLYRNSSLFIYPSLFEGFGLPPLEAMASGVPVIVHNGTSLPEVVGNAGTVIDTSDIKLFSDSIVSLINDEGLRNSFIQKGADRCQIFSWKAMAEKTLMTYTNCF